MTFICDLRDAIGILLAIGFIIYYLCRFVSAVIYKVFGK